MVRGGRGNAATGGSGNDYFSEMFPAFFLQAIEPTKVEVISDGSAQPEAVVRVTGAPAPFVTMAKGVNGILFPPVPLGYQVDYILEPGKPYLKIQVTVSNPNATDAGFPLVPQAVAVRADHAEEVSAGWKVRVVGEPARPRLHPS